MTSVAIDTHGLARGYARDYERREAPRTPPVQVVRGGRHGLTKARYLAQVAMRVLVVALALGLIVSVVYSQAKITELNGQINTARNDLTAAQSEYDYLSAQMSSITSRASVQEVAEGELNMVKADPSQITCINLEDESVIETTPGSTEKLLDGVRTAALSLLENLNP